MFIFQLRYSTLKLQGSLTIFKIIELSGTSTAIGKKMDVSEDHHINQNKPNIARKLLLFSLLWEFRKKNEDKKEEVVSLGFEGKWGSVGKEAKAVYMRIEMS